MSGARLQNAPCSARSAVNSKAASSTRGSPPAAPSPGGGANATRCERRFTTYERVEYTLPTVVKKDGQREPFDRQKILQQPAHRLQQAAGLDATRWSSTPTPSSASSPRAARGSVLARDRRARHGSGSKTLDEVAYVRFASVYQSFRDIDEFMAEMSKLVRGRAATDLRRDPEWTSIEARRLDSSAS